MKRIVIAVLVLPTIIAAPAARLTPRAPQRQGRVRTFWVNGHFKSDVTYRGDAYDGEYRTWYESGAPYELRHYTSGREAGLQQSWSPDGELYLNYEVRDGRRYGLVNATPCVTVESRESSLPYYDNPQFTATWKPVEHHVGSFRLVRQTGAAVSDADLRGRVYVASFLYTKCAALCPIVVRHLERVQRATNAMIVSFSVTPDADSPAALAAFGRERGVDPSRWWLVTGDAEQIYRLARTSYFADDNRAGATSFLHTEKLLLVDGDGRLRGVYNGTQPHEIDLLITDIAKL